MTGKELPHDLFHKWTGRFWFPDEEDNMLFGELSYDPDRGIEFSLMNEGLTGLSAYSIKDIYHRKVMFGRVLRNNHIEIISLFNVTLHLLEISNTELRYGGYVDGVLLNHHLLPDEIKRLNVQYDDHYNNFFVSPTNRDQGMVNLAKGEKLTTSQDWVVSLEALSIGSRLNKSEQLDGVFWSYDDLELSTLKETLASYLEKHTLYKRKTTNLVTSFGKEGQLYQDFIKFEHMWRLFFEFLGDHPISPHKAWMVWERTLSNGQRHLDSAPFLSQRFRPKKQQKEPLHTLHRNVCFFHFKTDELNLSNLKTAFDRWSTITCHGDWKTIIEEIRILMNNKEQFEKVSPFVGLQASVETLFDLLGQKKGDFDALIDAYASEKWIENVESKRHFTTKKSLGSHLSKIRNSIAHPKGHKASIHGKIRRDPCLLHFYYTVLGGLFLKAILVFLEIGDDDIQEKYCQSFIDNHSRISFIEYV